MQNLPSCVAVTGASGYIASWIVKGLLDEGVEVHATVRDPTRADRVDHLKAAAAEAPGELKIFAADLLEEGSFDAAFEGCEGVIHSASPFFIRGFKDAQEELITPALEGTRNVLGAVEGHGGIGRVVLTSSVVAMYGDAVEIKARGGVFTEEHWNETSDASHNAYGYSKTVAEREAWKLAESTSKWELVTVNPSFVLGPSLTARVDSTSIETLVTMLKGGYRRGLPYMAWGMVDVRDVAQAHLEALSRPEAQGRHIISGHDTSLYEIAKLVGQVTEGRYRRKLPLMRLPKLGVYILGPAEGFSWRYTRDNVDIPIKFDTTKAREGLGLSFRSMEETLRDHIAQVEAMDLV